MNKHFKNIYIVIYIYSYIYIVTYGQEGKVRRAVILLLKYFSEIWCHV